MNESELLQELMELRAENEILKSNNRILSGLNERQTRTIVGYHKAVEKAHDALKDVYHGE